MIRDLENMIQEERLKELGLFSLKKRKVLGNMVMIFKTVKGFPAVRRNMFFFVGLGQEVMDLEI